MQRDGILVSRILDISGRKSRHFQIVAANLSLFGIKGYNTVDLQHSIQEEFRTKQAFVQFHMSYYGKIQRIHSSDIFNERKLVLGLQHVSPNGKVWNYSGLALIAR